MNVWAIILLCYLAANALWIVARIGKVPPVKTPGYAVAQIIELGAVAGLVIAAVLA